MEGRIAISFEFWDLGLPIIILSQEILVMAGGEDEGVEETLYLYKIHTLSLDSETYEESTKTKGPLFLSKESFPT